MNSQQIPNKSKYDDMETEELLREYVAIMDSFRRRGVMRSASFGGEIGEYYAIKYYNDKKGFPNLQRAPQNTKSFDAICKNGKRYSIKSTTGKQTGLFYGMNTPDTDEREEKPFDNLIIVTMSKTYELLGLYELTWELFLKYRKWVKGSFAYNVYLNQNLISECIIRFDANSKGRSILDL